jgi:hypothetical protein
LGTEFVYESGVLVYELGAGVIKRLPLPEDAECLAGGASCKQVDGAGADESSYNGSVKISYVALTRGALGEVMENGLTMG